LDPYTAETRTWLDNRFRSVDADGVYLAHQPIYGFRSGHCEAGLMERYARTYAILVELAQGPVQSVLDVGAAEGYKADLARRLLGLRVAISDLSAEACRRGREIYGLDAVAADVHGLPFTNESFDVVLCSETLEHVADVEAALAELLRVARVAVLITVPHDSEDVVESVKRDRVPHGHIHRFDLRSFEFLVDIGCTVVARPILSNRVRWLRVLVDAEPRSWHRSSRLPRLAYGAYNLLVPILRRILGTTAAAGVTWLDARLSGSTSDYGAVICTVWKHGAHSARRPLRVMDVVRARVPIHHIPGLGPADG
jgi:SAM-dependent methyltransferase